MTQPRGNEAAERLLDTLERRKIAFLTDRERYEIDAVLRIVSHSLADIERDARCATIAEIRERLAMLTRYEKDHGIHRESFVLASDLPGILDTLERAAQEDTDAGE